jgi:hydroxymethylglutaryl-CoA reductase
MPQRMAKPLATSTMVPPMGRVWMVASVRAGLSGLMLHHANHTTAMSVSQGRPVSSGWERLLKWLSCGV